MPPQMGSFQSVCEHGQFLLSSQGAYPAHVGPIWQISLIATEWEKRQRRNTQMKRLALCTAAINLDRLDRVTGRGTPGVSQGETRGDRGTLGDRQADSGKRSVKLGNREGKCGG